MAGAANDCAAFRFPIATRACQQACCEACGARKWRRDESPGAAACAKLARLALALVFTSSGAAAATPGLVAAGCERDLVRVAVVEDELGTLPSVAEQYRLLRLPPLGTLAKRVVDVHACLELWDAAAPGGPGEPPALVFRIRPLRISLRERSLAAKAETAVTRYIGSYLGTASEDFPVVERAEVTLALHCPGKKGPRSEITAIDEGGGEGEPVQQGALRHPIDLNAERFARALRQATEDAVAEFRKEPAMCAASPR